MPARRVVLAALLVVTSVPLLAADPPLPPGAKLRLGSTKFRVLSPDREIALTPDGKNVIFYKNPRGLRFLSVETGDEVRSVPAVALAGWGGWPVTRSANGRWLVATRDAGVIVVEAATGKAISSVIAPREMNRTGLGSRFVGKATTNADGSRIAVFTRQARSEDSRATAYESATGRVVVAVKPDHPGTGATVLSPDGQLLATFGEDSEFRRPGDENWIATVQIWDVASGSEKFRIKTDVPNWVRAAAFSPDGTILVTAAPKGPIQAWDMTTGKHVRQFGTRAATGWKQFFAPDGKRLAASLTDGTVQVWETATGRSLGVARGRTEGPVIDVVFPEGGGPAVVLGTSYESFQVWTVPGQTLTPQNGHLAPATALRFTPDGTQIVAMGRDLRVIRWDAATGRELGELAHPPADNFRPFETMCYEGAVVTSGLQDDDPPVLDQRDHAR
jgi:hypothetical protein